MLTFSLALIPILLIEVLMLGLRWGAVRASIVSYLAALVIAVFTLAVRPSCLHMPISKPYFPVWMYY